MQPWERDAMCCYREALHRDVGRSPGEETEGRNNDYSPQVQRTTTKGRGLYKPVPLLSHTTPRKMHRKMASLILQCTVCLLLISSPVIATVRHTRRSSLLAQYGAAGSGDGDPSLSDQGIMELDVEELYTSWSTWHPCTRHCIQRRQRKCLSPKDCPGPHTLTQKRACRENKGRCARRKYSKRPTSKRIAEAVYDLLYYDWSDWSACTRSCKKRRYRTCAFRKWCKNTVLLEERMCFIPNTSCEKKYMLNPDWDGEESEGGAWEEEEENIEDTNRPVEKTRKKKHKKPQPTEESSAKPSPPVFYDPKTCGLRNVTGSLRIVGGQQSRKGSWPWQVAITTRWKEQYCGGALIHPQWVITAAHCVRKKGRRRKVLIRVGEYDLSSNEGTEQEVKIEDDFVHTDFDIDTIDSDIALLKLKTPIRPREHIGYACMPEKLDVLPSNTLCYAIGWGKRKDTHLFGTEVLREARVPLVENKRCQEAFDYDITNNQLCAGYRRGGVDTCAGDSGGPLMCQIKKDGIARWHVYGVTSFGEGCGDRGKFGIYTRVTNFVSWIKATMDHN